MVERFRLRARLDWSKVWFRPGSRVSFRHQGLRKFAENGHLSGIQPEHARRLRMLLAAIGTANCRGDIGHPGTPLVREAATRRDYWSLEVQDGWQIYLTIREPPILANQFEVVIDGYAQTTPPR